MVRRSLALTVAVILTALLAACSTLPSVLPPTAAPPTAQPPTAEPIATSAESAATVAPAQPAATEPAASSPLATPELTAPITPTVAVTSTGGAAPAVVSTPAMTTTAPTTSGAGPSQSAPARDTLVYRDDLAGFSIEYPATWSVTDVAPEIKKQSLSYSITFTSWPPKEPGTGGIPEGGSKFDLTVTKGGAATPDAALESRRQEITAEGAGSQITFEEPWDLPAGIAATHLVIQPQNGEPIQELVTALNGNRIVISGMGDASVFEQIVMTLQAVTPGAPATSVAEATPGAQAKERVVVPMVTTGNAPTSTQAATTTYTVKQGDTLAKIAARFGVTTAAILKANPQITNPDHIYIGQKIQIPTSGGASPTPKPQPTPPPAANTTRVNIYMIGIGTGNVGCNDQVVAVVRDVPKTAAPLTAALNLLLSQKSQYYGQSGLYNALYQSNLSIASISRVGAAWTIRLTGTLKLGGVCDDPRVKAQLEQTALQFSTVKSVQYFVNGKPLDAVLSEK